MSYPAAGERPPVDGGTSGGFGLAPFTAGFVAVLVGFTSSIALVFQAAQAAGATSSQIASWVLALCVGMSVTCIGLSWRYRMPIVTAWSTPGAALLASSLVGVSMPDAIGAFLFCGLLLTLAGVTGWFERVIDRIPMPLAAALLAGVLARFGMDAFVSARSQPVVVGAMIVCYLAGRRWFPRLAVLAVLLVGIAASAMLGLIHVSALEFRLARPEWVTPSFSPQVLLGVGLPLFIITMASQNVPGVAVLKASGYAPPVSACVTGTGLATLVLAPFGGFAFNLAAITAAICTGPEAHEDPGRRWMASVVAGVVYLAFGLLGASVATLFGALPREMVVAVAGLALLGAIASGLRTAMHDDSWREPALITFLVTLSGLSIWSINSAFWGLVAGVISGLALRR